MPVRLALVISGLVAGGSPGCRIVLCCFTHFPGVAIFVMAFLCSGVCVWLPPYPDRVDTMLSPLRSLLDVAELASRSHSLLVLLVFCFCGFVVVFGFVCFVNSSFLQHAIERIKRPGGSQEAEKRRLISLLQPLGDCLRCFLLLRIVGFRAGGRLPFK